MCLLNWFRPFVKNSSGRLTPIYQKLQKGVQLKWTDSDNQTIQSVLNDILQETLMNYPGPNKSFTLHTDASYVAVGAVTTQDRSLIGFYSSVLRNSETNYSTIEKKIFAIVKALHHFRTIIFNFEIRLKTDNKNLLAEKQSPLV